MLNILRERINYEVPRYEAFFTHSQLPWAQIFRTVWIYSCALRLCSSLSVRDHIPQTKLSSIILRILILKFLGINQKEKSVWTE